ncbi:MAG: sugar ABC transporter substrate-binding protein [Chloroflexi bacterium]|nr:sugar ABC transporter substrate-binding protein [Chloroflexota bacterium]
MSDKITRRDFLKSSVLAGAGLASASLLNACAPTPEPTKAPAPAAQPTAPAVVKTTGDKFDWKRFKGEKIEALLIKNTQGDIMAQNIKEFEELTGITVGVDQPAEQQQRQKLAVEFQSGQTSFDVVYYSFHVQKRLFGKNKWVTDIRDYLKDPTMTAPEFDWDDFSAAGKAWATEPDGRIDALPNKIDYGVLYCNKDLFAAKGVALPKTFDDVVSAAQKLHDPSKNVYGFVGRGLKNANAYLWCLMVLGWNIDLIDDKLNLNTTTPEAIESAKFYQNLQKNFAPPGVAGFNWNESQSAFALGQVAMWWDGVGFAAPLEDAKSSKVVGKVAYVVAPAGPKGNWAGMTGDGLGISSFSKKKGPAWYFAMWAASKSILAKSFAAGSGAQARNSVYTNPDALKNLTVPKEWVDTVVASGKIGRAALPIVVPVTEFRDIFGVALTNMIGGADPASELKKATDEFKPILEKSEKA